MILARALQRLIRIGELRLIGPDGRTHLLTGAPGPSFTIRITDPRTAWHILLRPDPAIGEAFMDGRLVVEDGTLYDFLDFCLQNFEAHNSGRLVALTSLIDHVLRRLHQYNPASRSQRNVAHHYDLDDRLYELFLDSDRQYSCAYFETPETGLEEAQLGKKRHLAAKLLLAPGQKVLDIGSGWGGLGLFLARAGGGDVTGLTLSTHQHEVSNHRAACAGLGERVRFELRDYRAMTGSFDRIVSVGMLEHVGVNHFGAYFRKVAELLRPDGVAVIHAIGRANGPSATSAWIRKYIFPGGYIPALSEILPAVERSGLWITDIEILRLHYAETLRHWRLRFLARREEVKAMYDERFCRMWEFYLVASELFFRRQDGMVFQIQLSRHREAVPLMRRYIDRFEAMDEAGRQPPRRDIAA